METYHSLFLTIDASRTSVFQGVDFGVILAFIFIIIFLFFSAFISGSETAFFSISPADREEIDADKKENELFSKLLSMPKRLLATILITNNLVNVTIIILSTYAINTTFSFGEHPMLGFFIEVVIITSLLLLFGEIIPKVYAAQNAVKVARRGLKPLNLLIKLFYPISSLLVKSTILIDKSMKSKGYDISIDELSDAIQIASNGLETEEEKEMLKSIVEFADIEAVQIMTPRVDVTALEYEMTFDKVLEVVLESGYSRIPVYKDNFDDIVGVLYIKDLLQNINNALPDFKWQTKLREPFFVPENKSISILLQDFKEQKTHIAILVDEYGGTAGIITMEDILEEIIGDISDEYDQGEDEDYKKIGENYYSFDGKAALIDVCHLFNLTPDFFDEYKGEAETIGGLILELKGSFPKKNEILKINNLTLKIDSVEDRRIKRVNIFVN